MILNDIDIEKSIKMGHLNIDPPPKLIGPSSIDLTLGSTFKILHPKCKEIDPQNVSEDNYYTFDWSKFEVPFSLGPRQFALAETVEKISIPNFLAAKVEGRSSMGRLGVLVHATAGYIDPGFEGTITLELYNLNDVPILLYPGQRVCQLVVEQMTGRCKKPYGHEDLNSKYQGQSGPTVSRIKDDTETFI